MSEEAMISGPFIHIPFMRHISWRTMILALITIAAFIAIAGESRKYGDITPMSGVTMMEGDYSVTPPALPSMPMRAESAPYPAGIDGAASMSAKGGMGGGGVAPDYYPYYYPGNAPASDSRELLKTYYNASMRTRDVPALVNRAASVVRTQGGRIDQESVSPKIGYVSFVVSIDAYERLRVELERLVSGRFLTVNVQSSNMLPQKQNVEEAQKQVTKTLADYESEKQKLASAHINTVKTLQSQIDTEEAKLADLRAQDATYDLRVQIQTALEKLAWIKEQLIDENASYSAQLESFDANIKYAKEWQDSLKTQDQQILDEVATVNGTVSIEWISLWDMARVYFPGYWIPAIFGVLTILSYLWDRRRSGGDVK